MGVHDCALAAIVKSISMMQDEDVSMYHEQSQSPAQNLDSAVPVQSGTRACGTILLATHATTHLV